MVSWKLLFKPNIEADREMLSERQIIPVQKKQKQKICLIVIYDSTNPSFVKKIAIWYTEFSKELEVRKMMYKYKQSPISSNIDIGKGL